MVCVRRHVRHNTVCKILLAVNRRHLLPSEPAWGWLSVELTTWGRDVIGLLLGHPSLLLRSPEGSVLVSRVPAFRVFSSLLANLSSLTNSGSIVSRNRACPGDAVLVCIYSL